MTADNFLESLQSIDITTAAATVTKAELVTGVKTLPAFQWDKKQMLLTKATVSSGNNPAQVFLVLYLPNANSVDEATAGEFYITTTMHAV